MDAILFVLNRTSIGSQFYEICKTSLEFGSYVEDMAVGQKWYL